MAGAFTTYIKQKIIEQFLRNNPITPASTIYVALYVGDPTSGGVEASYTGYARQSCAWTTADANFQTRNAASISFPANGNASAAVTITNIQLMDAASAGNALFTAALSTSKTLNPGDVLSFAAGAIVFGLS